MSEHLKSFENKGFMNAKEARAIRILCEYQEPYTRFTQQGIKNTVIFFGSARISDDSKLSPLTYKYYQDAEKLAKMLADWNEENLVGREKFYICTGGGPGIMEAANKGAEAANSQTIGLNISLPFEQNPNPYITDDLNFQFNYFFMRKLWFLFYAKAAIVFPGGFGTFDELFETLTLFQTKKLNKKQFPILVYGEEFWRSVVNFEKLAEYGVISEEDLDIFKFVNSPEEGFEYLKPFLKKLSNTKSDIAF